MTCNLRWIWIHQAFLHGSALLIFKGSAEQLFSGHFLGKHVLSFTKTKKEFKDIQTVYKTGIQTSEISERCSRSDMETGYKMLQLVTWQRFCGGTVRSSLPLSAASPCCTTWKEVGLWGEAWLKIVYQD